MASIQILEGAEIDFDMAPDALLGWGMKAKNMPRPKGRGTYAPRAVSWSTGSRWSGLRNKIKGHKKVFRTDNSAQRKLNQIRRIVG